MTNDVAGQGPALSEGLGPLPEPAHYWRTDVPGRAGPLLAPLYATDQMLAYAAAAVAAALDAREFVHAESSGIYARLAAAVRAGADDATLARLLRDEVNARA